MSASNPIHIAWFITPHGFGHAARATAMMLALSQRLPFHFDIFTRVPRWFFDESYLTAYTLHECQTDIGLAQRTSLDEDLEETLIRLAAFIPFDPRTVASLAQTVVSAGCCLVVSDIAPLGIAVAQAAGLPSVLVENFTWDWIYAGYPEKSGAFSKYIAVLSNWFRQATARIQTEPVCAPSTCQLTTRPVSRPQRQSRATLREELGFTSSERVVLITMGGIDTRFNAADQLRAVKDTFFIIPGGSSNAERRGNLLLLPHHSGIYHPDLVAACDAIIGKLGYSTLAEAYTAGIPYGYIPRARFRESPPLARFAHDQMQSIEISEESYSNGSWLELLPRLLDKPHNPVPLVNGADQAADYLVIFIRASRDARYCVSTQSIPTTPDQMARRSRRRHF